MKDKNLLDDRRKSISSKQSNTHPHHQTNGKNSSSSNARYQQSKNNTNSINFSDNKSNDRYKSNLKSLKRHTTRSENVREVKSSSNDTKHVNFNKRTSSTFVKNQYQAGDAEEPTVSLLRSSTVSKYHMPSGNSNSYSPFVNSVHTETVEQPTLMELECIAGYDGGLPQYFFLEAYDSRTKKLRLNITSALNDVPLFRIDLAGIEKRAHQNLRHH